MGFFDYRIEPDYEMKMCALARLPTDSNRIAERMVSFSKIKKAVRWYADEDIANHWDALPEVQVSGITDGGASLRAACIRWNDFPALALDKTYSIGRTVVGFIPYLVWPAIIGGIATRRTTPTDADTIGGTVLLVCGIILLLTSPRLFVFGEGSSVINAQPWLIGVKGVLDADEAAFRLFPGGNKRRHCNDEYTPGGSQFATPEEGEDGWNPRRSMTLWLSGSPELAAWTRRNTLKSGIETK